MDSNRNIKENSGRGSRSGLNFKFESIECILFISEYYFFLPKIVIGIVPMMVEMKTKRMNAAKHGQDYVMDRFFLDLDRPSGYFQMESKFRVRLLAEIKEQSKQSKQSNCACISNKNQMWIEIRNCSINNNNKVVEINRLIKPHELNWIALFYYYYLRLITSKLDFAHHRTSGPCMSWFPVECVVLFENAIETIPW